MDVNHPTAIQAEKDDDSTQQRAISALDIHGDASCTLAREQPDPDRRMLRYTIHIGYRINKVFNVTFTTPFI